MFSGIGDIVLISNASVLPQWDLPDRYLPPLTQETFKGLHLPKRESHRLTAAMSVMHNTSLTSVNRIIEYNLQLRCILVRCRCPLPG